MKFPFFKKKDPKAAFEEKIARARKEAEEKPHDLRLMTKIAELYLENGETANAIKEYLNVAKAYQSARKNSIVVGIYRHIISLDSSQVEVYHLLAEEFMKDMLMGDAVGVMVDLATHYYDSDMHYEAAQAIKKIKTIDPDNKFYLAKVDKFFKQRNLDPNAIEKIGPKSKWTLLHDHEIKQKSEDLRINPDAVGAFNLEQVLGESSISGFIDSAPKDGSTTITKEQVEAGAVFDQLKNFIDADANQDSPEFHYSLGLAYLRRKDYQNAHNELLKALYGISANKLDCYVQLTECSLQMKWFDDAKEYVEKAEKLDNLTDQDKMLLNYYMGIACKRSGDKKKALKMLRKVYDKDKNFRSVAREIREIEGAD